MHIIAGIVWRIGRTFIVPRALWREMAKRGSFPRRRWAFLSAIALLAPGVAGALPAVSQLQTLNDIMADGLRGGTVSFHDNQRFVLAEKLLERTPEVDKFAHAIGVGEMATIGQGDVIGKVAGPPMPLSGFTRPSDALSVLAQRENVALSPQQQAALHRLDLLPQPVAASLSGLVDAFLAVRDGGEGVVEDDFSRDFSGRIQLLEAIKHLHEGLLSWQHPSQTTCDLVDVPLAFSIELNGCDNVYDQSYALQLDTGGNDWYNNNAGGSNVYGGYTCALPGIRAALIDFGDGDDLYGTPSAPRFCGVNGGGSTGGMGFLFDEGGNDQYVAWIIGTNGGGYLGGTGFLLDGDGSDVYTAGAGGNGGGMLNGAGMLIDMEGSDWYVATGDGVINGGGGGSLRTQGYGFLIDMAGNDTYSAGALGTNGAGVDGGAGFLFDMRGDDRYMATDGPANGGGYNGGAGFLFDAAGDDVYVAGDFGTNGGGALAGSGMLVDMNGDDSYSAGGWGTNGGGSGAGAGALIDLGGNDGYFATVGGTNGGGAGLSTTVFPVGYGFLLDRSGVDRYHDELVNCVDCSAVPKGTVGSQLDI